MPSPDQIVRDAAPGRAVIGWKIGSGARSALLCRLPPRYESVVADHVTLAANVAEDALLPDESDAEIVARVDDDRGVEAMVVAIGGATGRPGGGTYHITWSLRPGREARESNDVLASLPWQPLVKPIPVTLEPARF